MMKKIAFILTFLMFSMAINAQVWKAETIVSEFEVDNSKLDKWFTIDTISNAVFSRMKGKSYSSKCTIAKNNLRYLKVLHRNKEGKIQRGELVCNKSIANDLIDIFRQLYLKNYAIERMVLVDEYDANDEKSMTANNTSCFNFRFVTGSKVVSKHGQGRAIDINPLYNPCYNTRNGLTEPAAGKPYATKRTGKQGSISLINTQDLCYKLFISHGFKWGGSWKSKKDYQHFEK